MRSRPKSGAKLVLFQRQDNDILFVARAMIVSAPEKPAEGEKYTVEFIERFDSPRSLTVLGGSLQKTRRFLAPGFHFKKWLVALSNADYQTIVEDRPDVTRSVFRLLFHALPPVVQSAFVREHAELFPQQERRSYRYDRLAEALVLFLEQRVGGAIQLADQFVRSYPTNVPDFPSLSDLSASAGDGTGSIPLGREVVSVADLGRTSPLMARAADRVSLLAECRNQLNSGSRQEERRRRWTDPIF
jgi:hypothetical protein